MSEPTAGDGGIPPTNDGPATPSSGPESAIAAYARPYEEEQPRLAAYATQVPAPVERHRDADTGSEADSRDTTSGHSHAVTDRHNDRTDSTSDTDTYAHPSTDADPTTRGPDFHADPRGPHPCLGALARRHPPLSRALERTPVEHVVE